MRLFIKVSNNSAIDHPIFEDNFREAFPDVDVNNLPEGFSVFQRIAPPEIGVYQVYEGVTYEKDGDTFKDVHSVRDMTAEEITEKQQSIKDDWAVNGYSSWQFNSESCCFEPPTAYPSDGQQYSWDEDSTSWVVRVSPDKNSGGN
jgi:hypothetical protein